MDSTGGVMNGVWRTPFPPWSADFSIVGIIWDNQLVPEASPKKDQSLFSLYIFQLDLHQKKVKSKVFYSFHFFPTENIKE